MKKFIVLALLLALVVAPAPVISAHAGHAEHDQAAGATDGSVFTIQRSELSEKPRNNVLLAAIVGVSALVMAVVVAAALPSNRKSNK